MPEFISLDRAGASGGAWPVFVEETTALLLVLSFALVMRRSTTEGRRAVLPVTAAGLLNGTVDLLFLAGIAQEQLAVLAVITALYPAITVLLVRVFLAERWSRPQTVGLLIAAAAVAPVSAR